MAEAGPQVPDIPALPPPPAKPPLQDPHQAAQLAPQSSQQGQQMVYLNWSHFKPEFSEKPEDAEAHLLRTNDWMNAHNFLEGIKFNRFSLTLVGESRLWYKSLTPINVDREGLETCLDNSIQK